MDHQVTTILSPLWSTRHRSQSQHRAESSSQVEYHDSLGMVKLPGGCQRGKTSVSGDRQRQTTHEICCLAAEQFEFSQKVTSSKSRLPFKIFSTLPFQTISKKRVEGTPILKLAMVKRLQVKEIVKQFVRKIGEKKSSKKNLDSQKQADGAFKN